MNDPHQSVMDIVFGRWRSQILYAGVKLGIFDTLGAIPKRADEVASELNLNRSHAYRLLRALASLGVLSENPNRSFSLTPSGEFL
ncbi:MAG: methyltransferase dimerization domain-containing protein, partial [Candidatus Caldarchaeum sp.]